MSIKELLPDYYDGVREFEVLFAVEDALVDQVDQQIQRVKANQWIQTADEQTIVFHEQLLGILANPEVEDLTFRRQRILHRLQSMPPFTVPYLRDHLNRLFGRGNYLLVVDHENYRMVLESSVENANWFQEANTIIDKIKPANLVYIQSPTFFQKIGIAEAAAIAPLTYFRIGRSRVGREPLLQRSPEIEVAIR
ncbi:YmfQ family protein [Enterococcus innesii]|uniref:putative phage tail protein n=1 Tax=Enterococcus innesii TaxID=2839759 RepID=UPI002DBA0256|nr:putative phage tail protein [Enterococcus innesii]MEB5918202.1 YmfQ family protein [Enterococcus innesii]